jgi:hypothetical protein
MSTPHCRIFRLSSVGFLCLLDCYQLSANPRLAKCRFDTDFFLFSQNPVCKIRNPVCIRFRSG